MKIIVTARYAKDNCDWEKFCDIVGLDYYCLVEGMDEYTEFTLTIEHAKELGLI